MVPLYSAQTFIDYTPLQTLTGQALLFRVADQVKAKSLPISKPSGGLSGRLQIFLGVMPRDTAEFTQMAINTAARSVKAKPIGSSHIVQIGCVSESAEIAAAFVNALVAEHRWQNENLHGESDRSSDGFEQQIKDVKDRLDESDSKLEGYLKQFGFDRTLLSDLSTLQTDRIAKQVRYELAQSSPVDSLPDLLGKDPLRQLRDRGRELRLQRADLTIASGDDNTKVKRIDQQIRQLDAFMEKTKVDLVERLKNDYEAALRREQILSDAYSFQAHGFDAEKAATYRFLKKDADSLRETYYSLLDKADQVSQAAALPSENIVVIDPATPDSIPSQPQAVSCLAGGAGAGAAFASMLIVMLELLRVRRLNHNTGEASTPPEIMEVPERRRFRSSFQRSSATGKASCVTDSFRQALTSILALQADQTNVVLVVSSVSAPDEKTTTAATLAVAAAKTGIKVLLVNADIRHPRLCPISDVEQGLGLTDLLSEELPKAAEEWQAYIVETSQLGLSVLREGQGARDKLGSQVFSPRLAELFSRLREMYEVVFIDTPPAALFPETRLFGLVADGAILAIQSGESRENAIAISRQFAEVGVEVLGTILSD